MPENSENLKNETPDEILAKKFKRMMRLFHKSYVGDSLSIMQESWLTFPQVIALITLRDEGPLQVCEVADRLNLSRSATSHLVDRLVRKRLVERREGAEDRRQRRVSLALKGEALIGRIAQSRSREITQAVSKMTPALKAQFGDFLDQVIVQFEAMDSDARPAACSSKRPASNTGR